MWVLLRGWMIADEQPSLPVADSLLRRVGIRLQASIVYNEHPDGADGVYPILSTKTVGPVWPEYRVTGTARNSRDFESGEEVAAEGQRCSRHAGAEFTIDAGQAILHVQSTGRAGDITDGSRVTVTGPLVVIGDYEWDAFSLPDVRTEWTVLAIERIAGDDDVLLDVEPAVA